MRRIVSGIVALALMLATGGTRRAWAATLAWGTYVGGSGVEYGRAVCTDQDGNIYLTGYTTSPNWAAGGNDTTYNGLTDAFVMKLEPTGVPVWSTYLGGYRTEQGKGIAVNASGDIYVCGQTQSGGWLTGAFDSTYNSSGGYDGFLVKLSGANGAITWGAYLGGENDDDANGLALDSAGNVCVAGSTYSEGWFAGGYDAVYDDAQDAYALKVSPTGALLWGTYLGGDEKETGNGIAVDSAGNIYVAGETQSGGWVAGGFRTTFSAQGSDGFVAKLTPQGGRAWSTYVSGSQATANALAIDRDGAVCVTGSTSAAGWTASGLDDTYGGGSSDGYLMKLSGVGQLLWSEYLGGSDEDNACSITIDASDQMTIVGTTRSSYWLGGGFDHILGLTGSSSAADAFVIRIAAGGQCLWGSYLGGDSIESGRGVAAIDQASLLVYGDTSSAGWIASPGKDTSLGGSNDAFLARIDQCDQVSSGSLYVTIMPTAAVTAGAQWRRAGTSQWRDSRTTETGVPYGHYEMEYTVLPGWARPISATTVDVASSKKSVYADYNLGGRLQVIIEPPEAVAAGAQWRYVGTSAWRDIPTAPIEARTGSTAIEYKPAPNWTTPKPQTILIQAGETTSTIGRYGPVQSELRWGRYLGGSNDDGAYGVALDQNEDVYITGATCSSGWVSNGFDTTHGYGYHFDAFVVKLSGNGERLWSTYLGGSSNESGLGIVADHAGNVYVTGSTNSPGWMTGGYNQSYSGSTDGFAVRLSPDGRMLWGAYLGGSALDEGYGVAVDKSDNPYITGKTASAGWLSSGHDTTVSATDAFVVRLSAATGQQCWGTYLGGAEDDCGAAIAVDDAANALYVTGDACSGEWVSGAYEQSFNGGADDAFLAKLSLTGDYYWSTLLGGGGSDGGWGVAVDGAGNVYLCGVTNAGGWARNGYNMVFNGNIVGGTDGFVAKVSPSGQPLWSAYLGGDCDDDARGIIIDREGNPLITGYSESSNWVSGGGDTSLNTSPYSVYDFCYDAFIVKLTGDGRHIWSGYLGEDGRELGLAIAQGASGDIYVAGWTDSDKWLTGRDSVPVYNSLHVDGFVARVREINQLGRGALRVTIEPEGLSGGRWRRLGQTMWRASGATEYNVPTGDYDLEFCALPAYAAPPPMTVRVSDGQTTTATGRYALKTGALMVKIVPPEAVAAGASWRPLNSKTWLESGSVLGGLPVTTTTISFSEIPGMSAPSGLKLPLQEGRTTSATVRYLFPGALCASITPPEAVAAGAQWRVKGLTEWNNSGATGSIPLGAQTVEFKSLLGWTRPGDIHVTVTTSATPKVAGTYVRQYGALQVNLAPAGATAAGAQWRRVGTTEWRASGEVESGIVEGTDCMIEYKTVPNWIAPPNMSFTIGAGVTDISANYQQGGSLAVTITPPAAAAAGAQWRRAGTNVWLDSGAIDAQAPVGDCMVEFKDLTAQHWLAPLPMSATIQAGKTASLAAAYAPLLLVSAVTPQAIPAALGQRVTLTAAAVGAAPLTFQWTKNGAPLAGATGLSLTLAACKLADEGAYACVARNPYAQASSPEFRVTVHNGFGVIAYLLGQSTNAAGLDLNADGAVTIADALKGVRSTPPATPSGPSPGSGATGLSIKPRLDWADSVDAASYDLYVWKSSASRPAAPTASVTASQYDVSSALAYGVTYKWQVIARRPEGAATASGPVWSFTTAKAPAGAPKAGQAGRQK